MQLMRWHRLAAWIGGTQLVIWIATGLAFSWFDFGAVRGTGDRLPAAPLDLGGVTLAPARAAELAGAPAASVTLRMAGATPVYVVGGGDADVAFDARGGQRVHIDADGAAAIARAGHRAHPATRAAVTAAGAGDDVPLPAWRVPLGDARRTDVFVAAATGEIVAWRTATYRQFDFLWSLHTLGYVNRDMPSHAAMRVVTALAALIALTGILLLLRRLRRRRETA